MNDVILSAIIGVVAAVVAAAISGLIAYKATMRATKEQIAANERTMKEQIAANGQAIKEQKEQAARDSLIQALQGEKESIGFIALRLSRDRLPQDEPYRDLILVSLVQAAIFSSSDRARAMVYSVLRDSYHDYRAEIDKIIASLENMFKQFEQFQLDKKELDLERGNLRLSALRKVLEEPTAPSSFPPSV